MSAAPELHYRLIQPPLRYPLPCSWELVDVPGDPFSSPGEAVEYRYGGAARRFRILPIALSIGLLSACSSLGQSPLFRSQTEQSRQMENCQHVQRDLSVSWTDRYYWCRGGGRAVEIASPAATHGEQPRYRVFRPATVPHLSFAGVTATPLRQATPVEPVLVFDEPLAKPQQSESADDDQIPVLTDKVELSELGRQGPAEQTPFLTDPRPVDAGVASEVSEASDSFSDQWRPVSEKIWFVKGLQVLGPKSTAKVNGMADRFHPDKTIWLEGKLQLSDLTELGENRAKLLSVGRALAVKKALRAAGVTAPIRIKYPRLMAVGRFVTLEQA